MIIAAATIRMRPSHGPAIGKAPLPVTATVLSAMLHVVLAIVYVLAPHVWSPSQPKTYIVNLVPAVAAVGSPQGQATPALPPRPEEVAPALPARPTELPQREATRETTAPEMPARARELPDRAIPGQQPVAVFEINRDGRVTGLAIEKPSGNPYYDQAALRAITEAAPFPPLPPEFSGPVLRVHLGFNFSAERG